jgi:hypothetical protein
MQDRICQIDETLLQRTAGPYMRVRLGNDLIEQMFSASTASRHADGRAHGVGAAR